jgi:phosphate/sulfate permease
MSAHTLILIPAAGFVIAAATVVLIRTHRKREDKLRRRTFRNVCKLEDKLNSRKTAKG